MNRLARLVLLGLLLSLASNPLFAQYRQQSESTEAFRSRLLQYMTTLADVKPSAVTPEIINSVTRMNAQELELLQKAFPKEEWFWSAPGRLLDFIGQNGGVEQVPDFSRGAGSAYSRTAPSRQSGTAEGTKPTVTTFAFSGPTEVMEGNAFTFSYDVTDTGGSHLKRFELWRAMDKNGSVNMDTWTSVQSFALSGDSASGTFSYTPGAAATFWFGCHAIDNDGNTAFEPTPIKGKVNKDPNKQCPTGFDYEALWLARDADTVTEIAKELIPEDSFTAVPYAIVAVAWSVAHGMKFTVEQIYGRWQDCENNKVFDKIDASMSSRASQATANDIWAKVNSFDFTRLDTSVSSRASQTSVNTVQTTLNGLSTANLDAKISTRATQDSVNDVKTKVDTLDTSNLDAKVTTRATQTSVDNVKAKVDTTLDVNVSTRATQVSVDNVKTKLDTLDTANLDVKLSTRATQGSVDGVKAKVDTLDTSRLDVPVSTRAQELTLMNRTNIIDTALNGAHTKLDALLARADVVLSTRASQDSIDAISTTLQVQEPLTVQAVELEKGKRYVVQVTKRGAPLGGATVEQFQVLTTDKNGMVVATALSPTVREVAPGILDVVITLAPSVQPNAFAVTVAHTAGPSALRGSAIWSSGWATGK